MDSCAGSEHVFSSLRLHATKAESATTTISPQICFPPLSNPLLASPLGHHHQQSTTGGSSNSPAASPHAFARQLPSRLRAPVSPTSHLFGFGYSCSIFATDGDTGSAPQSRAGRGCLLLNFALFPSGSMRSELRRARSTVVARLFVGSVTGNGPDEAWYYL